VAVFFDHIAHVVSVRAEEQMIWIAARARVAMVTDKETGRDRPNEVLVGYAMGACDSRSNSLFATINYSVPRRV